MKNKMHTFVAFFWVLGLKTASAKGSIFDNARDYFGSQNTSPVLLLSLGFVLVVVVGLLVILEIRKADHFHRRKMEIGWKKFYELAKKMGLTDQETLDLEVFLRKAEIISADAVFSSPLVFENCLETYLSTFGTKTPDSEYEKVRHLRELLGYHQISVDNPYVSSRQLGEGVKVFVRHQDVSTGSSILVNNEKSWSIKNGFDNIKDLKGSVKVTLTRFSDGEYAIKAPILLVTKNEIVLAHTRDLTRKQLRNWVRVEINLTVKVKLLKVKNQSQIKVGNLLVGKLSDISGGGVSLKIPTMLDSQDQMELDFELNGHKFKRIKSRVIRVNQVPMGKDDLYQHSLEFEDMESQTRERVIRFVFDKQRQDTQWR